MRILPLLFATLLCAGAAPDAAAEEAVPDIIESCASIGRVAFPHAMHVDDLGFDCTDCHHETNASKLTMPHEDYFEDFWIDCTICHRGTRSESRPRSCSMCHHSMPSAIADQTLSAKVFVHRSCWECHDVGAGAAASRECSFCHEKAKGPCSEKAVVTKP